MAKFDETLGALLRDLAYARVKSDLFSREASLEYLKDPLLRLFPVPRVEMSQAEIEVSFAVKEARQNKPEPRQIARQVLTANLPALRDSLFSVKAGPGTLGELLGARRAAAEKSADTQLLKVFTDDEASLTAQVMNEPAQLAQSYSRAGLAALNQVAEARKLNLTFGLPQQKEVDKQAALWAKAVNAAAQAELERAQANAFELDLAFTREELENVAPHLLARVKLSVSIENYEWAESEDADGKPTNKLVIR
jgi:hypothetical protein